MGQKVNPTSLRIGINKGWESNWYARKQEFGAKLIEDYGIRQTILKYISKSDVSKIIIERSLKKIIVSIHTPRPGKIIGVKGVRIAQLTEKLQKKYSSDLQIDTIAIKVAELDAKIVAEGIAASLEARGSYRRAGKQAMDSAMRMGAQGISVVIAGRLGGAEIARREKMQRGRVPRHTIRADIDYATAEAKTTYGIIGIKIAIFKGYIYGKRDLSLNLEAQKFASKPALKAKQPFKRNIK